MVLRYLRLISNNLNSIEYVSEDKFKDTGLNFKELSNNIYKITQIFRKLANFPFKI